MQETVLPGANAPYPTLLYVLIPLLPFVGFLLNGLLNKKLSGTVAGLIGSATVLGSFLISVVLFLNFKYQYTVQLFDWISVGSLQIPFQYQIDQLSLIMLLLVTGVGFLIHVYSIGYMHHDENVGKFFSFLNLFIFSMLLLVMGANFVILFIGWEGVGLCSYLLIGFWNKNTAYNNAAKKAFIINRIGDLGFLLGIFLIYLTFNSVQYAEVFQKASLGQFGAYGVGICTAITLLLFVGAMGKSAQLPLYTWLPDAMAGPTPVSALIHAATMVTAGIYMVLRANVLFTLAPDTLEVVAIVGAATALFAATIGLAQNDIKKVLAYSTVSQLGYMFLALGVLGYSSALFHVLTHAFFKALMFLGAGSVIHAMSNEQDLRRMGGLRKALPITFVTFLIGCLAISGIPPFSGFFSKDEILAHAYEHNKVLWVMGLLTAFLTAFYMFRLLFLAFFGEFRGTAAQKQHLHESPASMTLPLVILAVLAAVGGFMGAPMLTGGHHYLAEYLAPIFTYSQRLLPEAFAAKAAREHRVHAHGPVGGRWRAGHRAGLRAVRGPRPAPGRGRSPALSPRAPGVPQILHRRTVQRADYPAGDGAVVGPLQIRGKRRYQPRHGPVWARREWRWAAAALRADGCCGNLPDSDGRRHRTDSGAELRAAVRERVRTLEVLKGHSQCANGLF